MQGIGLFSKLAGYVRGAKGAASGMHAALGRNVGAAGRTAMYGAGAGGAYGAMSDDTSVLGGMAMGATLGLGGRYARAGMRAGSKAGYMATTVGAHARSYGSAFSGGVARRVARDYAGASVRTNRAANVIKGLYTR